MTLPQGATNVVIVNLYGYLQQRYRNTRALFYTISILPIIMCSSLLWKLPSTQLAGRFFAITWFPTFTSAVVTLSSLTVTNVSGYSKKSLANGMFLMGYAIGQVSFSFSANVKLKLIKDGNRSSTNWRFLISLSLSLSIFISSSTYRL